MLRVAAWIALVVLVACSVYDEGLLHPRLDATPGGGSSRAGEGGALPQPSSGSGGAENPGGGEGGEGGEPSLAGGLGGTIDRGTAGSPDQAGQGGATPSLVLSIVDDFENGDFRIETTAGRQGDWFVANDGSPDGTMLPPSFMDVAAPIEKDDPTFGTNGFALHTSGSGFNTHAEAASNWGALVGCNLDQVVTTKNPYDASAYCGVSFSVRGSFTQGSSPRPVHVRLTDQWTIPDAGNCGESWACNAHAGKAFIVPEVDSWTTFVVPFDELVHPSVPDHTELDRTTVYSIEFTFEGQGEFDLWLDDLALVECPLP